MPNRIVRESILTSESVCSLDWGEEVFYRRLMHIVDDYGRHEANPQLLRSRCYPLQVDKVRVADITRWMAACQKAGVIVLYEAGGKAYVQIEKFGQQQRSPSKHPPPPTSAEPLLANDINRNQAPANEHLDVFVFGDVSEGVGVSRDGRATPVPTRGRKAKTPMPAEFGISERVKAWAHEKGYGQLADHLEAFRRKVAANGYAYADWDAAFMEAIREDWAKLRGRSATAGQAPPPESPNSEEAARTAAYLAEQDAQRAASRSPEVEAARQMALMRVRRGLSVVAREGEA